MVWFGFSCCSADYGEAEESYTKALQICPACFQKDRAVLFSNRAAAKMKQVSVGFIGLSLAQMQLWRDQSSPGSWSPSCAPIPTLPRALSATRGGTMNKSDFSLTKTVLCSRTRQRLPWVTAPKVLFSLSVLLLCQIFIHKLCHLVPSLQNCNFGHKSL